MPGKAMYRHILIATDGSRSAGKAVATGLALAAALKAEVTAITAEEPFEALLVAEPSQRLPMAEFEHAAAESARRILAEVSERAREQGYRLRHHAGQRFPGAGHPGHRQSTGGAT